MTLIECPRDAMQGIEEFIPTEVKTEYINSLLNIGFDTIDFGSFVSPKAIPQMRDTADVLKGLHLNEQSSKLLAIIANKRGAEEASQFDEIAYLGFPFSVSETFQLRNTNSTIGQSLHTVEEIQKICTAKNKKSVVYLSMSFGNPYNDPWDVEVVEKWARKLSQMGVSVLALSDTIGVSNPQNISYLFSNLIPALPNVEFGAHLHSTPSAWKEKIDAAYKSGCRRFDSAIKGFGGCPMATDTLTGNIATENVLAYLDENNIAHSIHAEGFVRAMQISSKIFH